MEMVFRHNGNILRDPYFTINSSIAYEIFAPVSEGVYDCVFKLDRTYLSQASNAVFIYSKCLLVTWITHDIVTWRAKVILL